MTKKEILVCDDSQGVQSSLKLILDRDFNITLVGSESHLFEVLRSRKNIELILLDFGLGETNGIDVLIKIKAEFSHTKVIMITGHKDEDIMKEAFRYGACDFILKPFKADEILDSVYRNLFV